MLRSFLRGTFSSSRLLSTETVSSVHTTDSEMSTERKMKNIGKALETYLKHARVNAAMMARERAEFDLGKRHLANMLGVDPHALTQTDIDRAIAYLFPSGLSDPKARPVMKSPEEILPRFHHFNFDDEGRPKNSRFFSLFPKFYGLLSEIGVKSQNVNRFFFERASSSDATKNVDLRPYSLSGTTWLNEEQMKKKLGEKFSSESYVQLLMALDYLASLPGSSIEADFINEYRVPITSSTTSKLFGPGVPEVELCAQTQRRTAQVRTRVKDTRATVFVSDAGTGKWTIDGYSLSDVQNLQAREILLCPMIVSHLLGRVDVVAKTEGSGGTSAIPRAIRHGTALCIAALYPETTEKLRLAGLLTADPRKKERSKVNQPGARAKWIWKRR